MFLIAFITCDFLYSTPIMIIAGGSYKGGFSKQVTYTPWRSSTGDKVANWKFYGFEERGKSLLRSTSSVVRLSECVKDEEFIRCAMHVYKPVNSGKTKPWTNKDI